MARRLAAILAADVVGYSRLMGAGEAGTLQRLKARRRELVQPRITARALVAAGASVNWLDGEQVTPLILAAHKNHPAVARLLLDAGADPAPRDRWGRQALDYALRRGADDPIARLIRARQAPGD